MPTLEMSTIDLLHRTVDAADELKHRLDEPVWDPQLKRLARELQDVAHQLRRAVD